MELDGISALITGGASGLGEATARHLTDLGATITIADLQDDKGEAVAGDIGATYVNTDVTDADSAQAAVDAAAANGPLRLVANCAGIGWAQRTIDREGNPHDLGVFEKVVAVNLVGTFNVIRIAAGAMAQTDPLDDDERGAIVNIASVAAFDGQTGQASYSASKGGIVGMTLPIARDLAAVGIRVCTIAPGLIDTPLFDMMGDEGKAKLGESVLFPRRLGEPSEVASLIAEIGRNSYLNGETIRLDGGIRMPPK
jgi:NAD(P)-dependent dehydrogenase (short-subunit alcohol dehydrogenase family)